ncbi:MAG: hypothetical protein EXQ82_09585 [Pseudolabrys sp.]|nr:hypothetical protein [Pseudolabrys sp.]
MAEHAEHPDIGTRELLRQALAEFFGLDWRSVSAIRQALIFLSPPRNFSSIDTGWPAGSTALQISQAATPGSCTSFSASDVSAAASGCSLNRTVTA